METLDSSKFYRFIFYFSSNSVATVHHRTAQQRSTHPRPGMVCRRDICYVCGPHLIMGDTAALSQLHTTSSSETHHQVSSHPAVNFINRKWKKMLHWLLCFSYNFRFKYFLCFIFQDPLDGSHLWFKCCKYIWRGYFGEVLYFVIGEKCSFPRLHRLEPLQIFLRPWAWVCNQTLYHLS